jgi:hypothetical protein
VIAGASPAWLVMKGKKNVPRSADMARIGGANGGRVFRLNQEMAGVQCGHNAGG